MRVAITGGTGFVGRHFARRLMTDGHEVVLIARGEDNRDTSVLDLNRSQFFSSNLSNTDVLVDAFAGCDAVVHCAGINREIREQTYQKVHIEGTRNVCDAARHAGVRKIVLLSFLRARPDCGSAYHESKWAAEEIVRHSELDYTIFKAGVIYGQGDHMLDHLSHALYTFPVFALVGMTDQPIRPLAVEDLASLIERSLFDPKFTRRTFAVTGPEEILLGEAVKRVAAVIGKRRPMIRMPLAFHYLLAWIAELTMKIPLTSLGQVRILSEGIVEALPPCESLPDDLLPATRFTQEQIRKGLPEPGRFRLTDLRCCLRKANT
ncbi:MAG TPA: NAD(P)H-binding protein [Candidatus Acidoferrales bacterium]|nr:NAD(P)H-binding protein [Candidatus Acidoferrales bacterium]